MQSEEAIELNLKTYTPVKDNICPYLTAGGFQCVHPKGGQLILWGRPTLYNFDPPAVELKNSTNKSTTSKTATISIVG